MRTITIEDPRDAELRAKAAFPDALLLWASLYAGKEAPEWRVHVLFTGGRPDCMGKGATADEAIADARRQYDAHNPKRDLEEKAKALGFALMPLPTD